MCDKTKEQLLEELSEVQRMLEERTEIHGQMIRKFKMFLANDSLFTQIIDYFPYPMAMFTSQYTLSMVNKAFTDATNIRLKDTKIEEIKILRYKAEDMQLAAAITNVFDGKTSILENLKNPFSIFSGIDQQNLKSDCYTKATVFPVSSDDSVTTHGVIVFMT